MSNEDQPSPAEVQKSILRAAQRIADAIADGDKKSPDSIQAAAAFFSSPTVAGVVGVSTRYFTAV